MDEDVAVGVADPAHHAEVAGAAHRRIAEADTLDPPAQPCADRDAVAAGLCHGCTVAPNSARISRTGTLAALRTRSDTEPISARWTRLWPWEPITTRSHGPSSTRAR